MEEKHLEVSITRDPNNNYIYEVLSQTHTGERFGDSSMLFWRNIGDEFDYKINGLFCRLISADYPELRPIANQTNPILIIFVGGVMGSNRRTIYAPSHFNGIPFNPNMVLEAVGEYNIYFNSNQMKRIPIKKYLK
jgi:hypothetical protein